MSLITRVRDAYRMGFKRGGVRWLLSRNKGKDYMSEARIISDALTSVLEDLIHRKILRRDRAQYWSERLGKGAGLEHLLPRRLRGEALKEAIRRRIHGPHNLYEPVPLPDRRRSLSEIFQVPPWQSPLT